MFVFLGYLISVLGLVIAFLSYKHATKKKSLIYWCDVSSIVSYQTSNEHKKNIKIFYDDIEVKSPKTIDLSFKNNGGIPIKGEDFTAPIEILTPDDCLVISSSIQKKKPVNLGVELLEVDGKVLITPSLMNPGDSFTLKINIDFDGGLTPVIQSRIYGVDKIREHVEIQNTQSDERISKEVWLLAPLITMVFAAFLFYLSSIETRDETSVLQNKTIQPEAEVYVE